MPNFLEVRGLKSQDIVMDAQLIKAVPIDDSAKADEKVLAYNLAAAKLAYVPKCPEILIKAIQHVTITFTSGETSHQVLINEVDMDKTFLILGGTQSSSGDITGVFARIELTDSTHITATRHASGVDLIINLCVIECTAGINSVQRGTIHLGMDVYVDDTITAVDTDKTFVSYLGVTTPTTTLTRALIRVFLFNSTTVRAQRDAFYSEMDITYEAVEFV